MSNETAVAIKHADAPAQWGSREEVGALAQRFAAMLPNSKDFDRNELLAIAQYCVMADVNPFRGEVYFYKDRGKLQMVDGYKILVRWAKDQDPYQDRDEDLPRTEDQAEHIRVWILKDADRHKIKEWTEMGAPWRDAFEMVATYADGVVTKQEANRQPPTGWTWRQVARKRALKNVLNLSHGAPSPQEMAEYRMKVNGVQTVPSDWQGAEELSGYEAERLAQLRAETRQHQQGQAALSFEERQDKLKENVQLMRGDPTFEGFDDEPDSTPLPEWDGTLFSTGEEKPDKTNGHHYDSPQARAESMRLAVNRSLQEDRYKHIKHLLNAIALEADNQAWTWPNVDDDDGWRQAFQFALAHARKETD